MAVFTTVLVYLITYKRGKLGCREHTPLQHIPEIELGSLSLPVPRAGPHLRPKWGVARVWRDLRVVHMVHVHVDEILVVRYRDISLEYSLKWYPCKLSDYFVQDFHRGVS